MTVDLDLLLRQAVDARDCDRLLPTDPKALIELIDIATTVRDENARLQPVLEAVRRWRESPCYAGLLAALADYESGAPAAPARERLPQGTLQVQLDTARAEAAQWKRDVENAARVAAGEDLPETAPMHDGLRTVLLALREANRLRAEANELRAVLRESEKGRHSDVWKRLEEIATRVEHLDRGDALSHAEQIVAWQEATGLTVGGDPGGVTPAHLQAHVQQLDAVVQAAKAALPLVKDRVDRPGFPLSPYQSILDNLRAALAALPKED